MASNNTVSKRKKPDEKKEKVKKEKPAPLGLNKYGAGQFLFLCLVCCVWFWLVNCHNRDRELKHLGLLGS